MLTLENLTLCESMSHLNIARAAIPGGWLVYITHTTSNEGGCCFVPDAAHEWDGSSLPVHKEQLAPHS